MFYNDCKLPRIVLKRASREFDELSYYINKGVPIRRRRRKERDTLLLMTSIQVLILASDSTQNSGELIRELSRQPYKSYEFELH